MSSHSSGMAALSWPNEYDCWDNMEPKYYSSTTSDSTTKHSTALIWSRYISVKYNYRHSLYSLMERKINMCGPLRNMYSYTWPYGERLYIRDRHQVETYFSVENVAYSRSWSENVALWSNLGHSVWIYHWFHMVKILKQPIFIIICGSVSTLNITRSLPTLTQISTASPYIMVHVIYGSTINERAQA